MGRVDSMKKQEKRQGKSETDGPTRDNHFQQQNKHKTSKTKRKEGRVGNILQINQIIIACTGLGGRGRVL